MLGHQYAYRVVYEQTIGPCPDGVAHHKCENSWCVNPDHLEFIPQGEHLIRHGLSGDWGQAEKSACPQGHPYSGDNLYIYERSDGSRERHCKTCRRAAKARYRARAGRI